MHLNINIKFSFPNLFLIIFLLIPVQSFSEMISRWEIIEVGEKSIFFIDRDSIVINEDVGRIWQLQNYRDVMRLPPQSISTQMDYHCGKSKNRIFVQYHHTGVMSKGRLSVANIEGKDDWVTIEQNSKEARIFKIICEKEPQFEIPKTLKDSTIIDNKNPDDKNTEDKNSENKRTNLKINN